MSVRQLLYGMFFNILTIYLPHMSILRLLQNNLPSYQKLTSLRQRPQNQKLLLGPRSSTFFHVNHVSWVELCQIFARLG